MRYYLNLLDLLRIYLEKLYYFLFIFALLLIMPSVGFCQLPIPKWVNDMGGGGDSKPTAMVVDKNNNIYVSGYFSGTVDFDPSAGVKNLTSNGGFFIYVSIYTPAGVFVWADSLGGGGLDQVSYMCVDANGNITIAGQDQSPSFDADPGPGVATLTTKAGDDIFFIHFDTNGKYLWGKVIAGDGTERGEEVNADSQGNVIVTAIYSSQITVGAKTYTPGGDFNGLIVKYSEAGNLLWSIPLQGIGIQIFGNAVDSQDNIIVSGTFSGTVNFDPLGTGHNLTASATDMPFVAKYNSEGKLLWVYKYSGTLTNNNSFINVDANDNIRLSGAFTSALTFNGNTTITGGGSSNIFIAKFLPDGTFQWAKPMSGNGGSYSFAYQMQTDQDGNAYLTGYITGTVDFNPDPSVVANISYHGQRDFFLAKFDSDGNYKWAFSGGSSGCDQTLGLELAINSNRDLFLGGSFCQTVDFDPSTCSLLSLTARNNVSDTFIAAYSQYTPSADLSQITNFNIPGQVSSVIDATHATITVIMPVGTDLTQLRPAISTDKGGTVTPASGQLKDFTKPVNYVVGTSCSSLTYTVTVILEAAANTLAICPDDANILAGDNIPPPDTYLWQLNQGGTWVAAAGINNNKDHTIAAGQFQNTSGTAIVYSFRRHVTTGAISSDDSYYNVTVSPSTQNNSITSDLAQVCAGQQVVNFTGNQPVGYTANVVYAWQQSTDNITWTNISGSGQQNYQFTGSLTQSTYFRRSSAIGTCVNYSNVLLIGYQPAVTTANAGLPQVFCQQTQATLNANTPAPGEVGTWSVVSPANYNPFTAANVNNPQAVISNLPLGVTVNLKWSIFKTSCGQTSESTVAITNNDKDQIVSFTLNQQTAPAKIDQVTHTITINVFYGTNVTALTPQITSVNNGTISPAPGTPQNFTSPVTYSVNSACGLVNYQVTVTANGKPTQLFQCPASVTTLTGDAASGTVNSYEWQVNNNGTWVTASNNAITADYQAANLTNSTTTVFTYNFRRKINSPGGIIYDSFYDVSLNPAISNTIVSNLASVCASAPQNIVFTGNVPAGVSTANITYRWEKSADTQSWATISGATGNGYTTLVTQTQYFRRVATVNGCDYFSGQVKIEVYGPVTTANAGANQSACNQASATLAANAVASGETGTWSVVSPASYQPFNINNIHNPNAVINNLPVDTDVKLMWTIDQTVCGTSSVSTVTIRNNGLPVVDAGPDAVINAGETAVLKANVGGSYVSVRWVPAEGLSDATALNPVASPLYTTDYQLTVTTAAGCTISDNVKITVKNAIVFPNTFTPNGDGVNDTWNIKNITVYENAEVYIFTRWGKRVFYSKGYPVPWNGSYEGKKVPAGVYYYLITISDMGIKESGALTVIY